VRYVFKPLKIKTKYKNPSHVGLEIKTKNKNPTYLALFLNPLTENQNIFFRWPKYYRFQYNKLIYNIKEIYLMIKIRHLYKITEVLKVDTDIATIVESMTGQAVTLVIM
jgi:hypothetical protein